MSLTYYEDANMQPMPKMFSDITWNKIKEKITSEVKNLNRNIIYNHTKSYKSFP